MRLFQLPLMLMAGMALAGWQPYAAADNNAPKGKQSDALGSIDMTWMSIANWYFRIGDVRLVMDGYVSRVPGPPFFVPSPLYPNDLYATTRAASSVDEDSVARVIKALPDHGKLDFLVTGHSHFDHSWDTPTWARLTGAPVIGAQSTCYQAQAQGLPKSRCRVVVGGENILLGKGVTMRVIRFNHSGDDTNPIQHYARELSGPPVPDPVTGGLRAGVGEDYPNGGGVRAFLFVLTDRGQRLSVLVQDSASAFDFDKDIVVEGKNFGSPLANLKAAMAAAQLQNVDVWIATGGLAVAQLIVPVIHPKVYIPSHWDGLFNPLWAGLPFPYEDNKLKVFLDSQKILLLPQHQYFDTFRLTANGVALLPDSGIKKALGFADIQGFVKAGEVPGEAQFKKATGGRP